MTLDLTDSDIQEAISTLDPKIMAHLTDTPPDATLHAIRHGYSDMLDHASDTDPEECVGMLWHTGEVTTLINQSRSDKEFSVGESQFLDALTRVPEEYELVAVYHSHPHSSPFLSHTDLTMMRNQWGESFCVPWVVICPNGNLYCWILNDDYQPEVAAYLTDWDIWVYGPNARIPQPLPWSLN